MAALKVLAAGDEALKLLPATDELIWGSAAFLVLFLLLSKLAFPKLKAGLAERSAKIQGQLEEAERTKLEADKVLEQYRQQVADARNEAAKIVEEGRKAAEAVRAELVAKAQAEADQIIERARTDAAGERDRAIAELKSTVGTLSLSIASKVISKELSSNDAHKQLVDSAIGELAKAKGNGNN